VTQRRADLGLVLLTVIWGTTFALVHDAVRAFPPIAFLALRFGIASLALVPVLVRARAEWREWLRPGLILGALLFGSFATQTIGLAYTTPARAGFITGLSVVLVPVIGLAFGQRAPRRAAVGVALAIVGLAVVSFGCRLPVFGCEAEVAAIGSGRLIGDLWTLGCAVLFAFHIVGVSHWTARGSPVVLNAVQIAVVAILAAVGAAVLQPPAALPSLEVWAAAAFLGLVATALALAMWLVLQPHTTATHAALIFALEPVFAALFSWIWTGEAVTLAVWSGGTLMIAGVLIAEIPLGSRLEGVPFLRWLAKDPMAH
jgi:drug/metabolite transporter (DMT)-like permease